MLGRWYIPKGTNSSSKDYYVSFNGASGINREIQTGPNKVLVHHRAPGTDAYTDDSDSTLATIMESGKTSSRNHCKLHFRLNICSSNHWFLQWLSWYIQVKEMTPYRCCKKKDKSLCPNACGNTAIWCSRDAKDQLRYGVDENGETIYKGCPYVGWQPEMIASRCSKGNVALACRATCSNF